MVHDAGDLGLKAVYERAGLPATFLAAIVLSLLTCGYLAMAVRPADVRAAEASVRT